MSSPQIRRARPEEYHRIADLTVGAYLADREVGEYEAELRRVGDRAEHGIVLVATDGAQPLVLLGTVTVLVGLSPWTELAGAGDAEIRMLAVDPGARERGVGTALAVAAIDTAREAGARQIVLSTQSTARPAHRIYDRLGFTRRSDLDWSPRRGVDLLGYSLDLRAESDAHPG